MGLLSSGGTQQKPKKGLGHVGYLLFVAAFLGALMGYILGLSITSVHAQEPQVQSVAQLRSQVDALDDDLLLLLNRRQELSEQINTMLILTGQNGSDEPRRKAIIARLQIEAKEQNSPLSFGQIADIWTTLMLISRALQ